MTFLVVLLLIVVQYATAQVPGFGGCPDFETQQDFDMNRFLGTWYEAERYVNIFEAGTRCVKTNYTKAIDGRFLVANEIMNRFTSVKRVLEGEIRLVVKGSESRLNVKYPNLPIPYESQFSVLETDYDSFAVMWSCSSLGIINTQNAWILTREKLPAGSVLQRAYGVLDKYKLSRTFFVKTEQSSCEIASAEPNKPAPAVPPALQPQSPAIIISPAKTDTVQNDATTSQQLSTHSAPGFPFSQVSTLPPILKTSSPVSATWLSNFSQPVSGNPTPSAHLSHSALVASPISVNTSQSASAPVASFLPTASAKPAIISTTHVSPASPSNSTKKPTKKVPVPQKKGSQQPLGRNDGADESKAENVAGYDVPKNQKVE